MKNSNERMSEADYLRMKLAKAKEFSNISPIQKKLVPKLIAELAIMEEAVEIISFDGYDMITYADDYGPFFVNSL